MMIDEVDMKYTITAPKHPKPGPSKTGTLKGITIQEITQILGITPNAKDDLEKTVNSWSFNAFPDDAELVFAHAFNERLEFKPGWYRCAIWDYKGSHHSGYFSTYGEPDVFKFLFGDRYVEM
jgi:hypothetical protein